MKENSAKYKQKSRAEALPFAKSDEAAFLLVFLFPLSTFALFYFMIIQQLTLFTHIAAYLIDRD